MKYEYIVKKTECMNSDNNQENQTEHFKKCMEVKLRHRSNTEFIGYKVKLSYFFVDEAANF